MQKAREGLDKENSDSSLEERPDSEKKPTIEKSSSKKRSKRTQKSKSSKALKPSRAQSRSKGSKNGLVEEEPLKKPALRILIFTDNHLGFKEDHPLRGKDSFEAVEEILSVGVDPANRIDFALQSGDLFHELFPSHECICKTFRIFEKHVFGEKEEGNFDFVPVPGLNESNMNFMSTEKKVKLPIVGIHGNHDYPMHISRDSAYEMLSITKNISYIGKCPDITKLVLTPVVFKHKELPLAVAIYGIGYIKDIQLTTLLEQKRYTIDQVPEEISKHYNVFSILLFHQNRFKGEAAKGGPVSIKYSQLPEGFDLVIWGHEHDCFTSLIHSENPRCDIYQPGSSVSTSFTEGEALHKHFGIVEVNSDASFNMEYVRLKTAREMICKEKEYIFFKEADNLALPRTNEEIASEIKAFINEMIEEAHKSNLD